MFYDIYERLCREKGVTPTKASVEIGFSKGSVSYWKKKRKEGIDAKPDSYTAAKIADYFGVSVDYLLGRTDDPIDYDNDGDALAQIPLTYVEAANGDMRKARAIMLAAERDAQREAALHSGPDRFSPQDAALIFALWGDAEGIDEKDIEDVRRFAAFLRDRKKKE